MPEHIVIRGARLHNLKNVSLSIPKNQLVVLTGLSGSGKSTLGFDILHREGQRQYMESLGMVTMGVNKAPVDSISGLSPSISIDQHLTNHSPRSTVGTVTDVFSYLRLLFARLGHRPCPTCGKDVAPSFQFEGEGWDEEGAAPVEDDDATPEPEATFPCPHCGGPIPEIGMANFSFNKPEGACPTCTGLGVVHQANVAKLVEADKSIPDGAVTGWNGEFAKYSLTVIEASAQYYGFPFDPSLPVKEYDPAARDLLLYGVESAAFRRHYPTTALPSTVRQGRFEGVATALMRRYSDRITDAEYREKMQEFILIDTCPDCEGTRLKPEARAVTVLGKTLVDLSRLPLSEIGAWIERLPDSLSADQLPIAQPVIDDLRPRIGRLVEVGAGYLTMDRDSPTLSAGEAQRLRLAALLGSGLSGVLYVFDEPTIGLHQRDTHRMIEVLRRLRDQGNTVLVIEHDLDMIATADYVVDFGPGAGKHGGQIVAEGTPEEVKATPGSLTGGYLARRVIIPIPEKRRTPNGKAITIRGARQHNLQNVTVRLPLGVLTAVTGVSGSGKSSLVFDILDRAVRQKLNGAEQAPGIHDAIEGIQFIDKIITIDQEHIGRIPRSNAATYSDTFTPIRETFAATAEAKARKLSAKHFSFNVPGGRCERCEGAGVLTVKMHFLPDVEVRCPACKGRRFKRETLAVKYRGCDISQVLDMTVEEALALFKDVDAAGSAAAAASRLQVLADVGLGYLQLGQPATTLSGGEAQRVKLAKELGRKVTGRTLYLLDEPTTGLHPHDSARLLGVLQRLVEAGNTVLVVEHNLEIVRAADWVIDLGPEGGAAGGRVIAEGTPEEVMQVEESWTGRCLREGM